MWLIFVIIIPVLFVSSMLLQRQAVTWSERTLSIKEIVLGGIVAWITFAALAGWFISFLLTLLQLLDTFEYELLWTLIFNVVIAGYVADFIIRSRSTLRIEDTLNFFQKSLVFRRTDYYTVDVGVLARRELANRKRRKREKAAASADPITRERAQVESDIQRGKRLSVRLKQLSDGGKVGIDDEWRQRVVPTKHELYPSVVDVWVDGASREVAFVIDLELSEHDLPAEPSGLLPLYERLYGFLQSVMMERWLKTYARSYDSFLAVCRAKGETNKGEAVRFPFLKVGIATTKLDELAASFFEGKNLGQVATVEFNKGRSV